MAVELWNVDGECVEVAAHGAFPLKVWDAAYSPGRLLRKTTKTLWLEHKQVARRSVWKEWPGQDETVRRQLH